MARHAESQQHVKVPSRQVPDVSPGTDEDIGDQILNLHGGVTVLRSALRLAL